jgi:hypothetical protein
VGNSEFRFLGKSKFFLTPYAYLKDVISRIADRPHKRLKELVPANWEINISFCNLKHVFHRMNTQKNYFNVFRKIIPEDFPMTN